MHRFDRLVKQLKQFGMSEKEAILYLTLSELGPSTIQEIAKFSKINRSTAHMLCEKLKVNGFIDESRKNKKRILFVDDIDKFRHIVEEEKLNVTLKEMALNGLLPSLHSMHPTHKSSPLVRFYEGEDGLKEICERTLTEKNNEILFLGPVDDFHKVITKDYELNYYIPKRKEQNIHIKMLTFRSEHTSYQKTIDEIELRETKFLPMNFKFLGVIFIYRNEIVMINSQIPCLGVLIESKELSATMSEIFKMLWKNVAEE